MPAKKYLELEAGSVREVAASDASAGAADAGKIPALGGDGKLDATLLPDGIGDDAITRTASEALIARDLVNVHVVGGAVRVRKAHAGVGGYPAHGFVRAPAAAGQPVAVYFDGTIAGFGGPPNDLTPGVRYYLSDSAAGGITDTPVEGAGRLHQSVGVAISEAELSFEPGETIIRA